MKAILGLVLICAALTGCNKATKEEAKASAPPDYVATAPFSGYKTVADFEKQDAAERKENVFYRKMIRGSEEKGGIAITIDHDLDPIKTPQLLKKLEGLGLFATIFITGQQAEKHPDLVKKLFQAGHLVGNRSYHNVNMAKLDRKTAHAEWLQAKQAVAKATGDEAKFARPPGGAYTDPSILGAMKAGLVTVLWSDDFRKGARPDRVRSGSVILLDDSSLDQLDILAKRLKGQFRFITVYDMDVERMRAPVRGGLQ